MHTHRYHVSHRILHAVMALLIPILFGLGLWMVDLGFYDPWYHKAPELHKSIGLLVFLLFLARLLVLRLFNKPAAAAGVLGVVAKITHLSMYLLIATILTSGYLISTAKGQGIMVFDWFELPALPPLGEQQADIAGQIHLYAAWALMGLMGLHILAALKHAFVDKDTTMQRMWGRSSH